MYTSKWMNMQYTDIKIVGEMHRTPIIDVTHTDIEINNLICIWQCQDGAYELRNNPPDPFK